MPELVWDQAGERKFENGVDHGVLYTPNEQGVYASGVAWNGLVSVTESPSGAEPNKQYADNRVYANLISAEEFGATIEAFYYPDEFEPCNGVLELADGVLIAQQNRSSFGLSYRTLIGNDLNSKAGYKLHLVYGCLAAPTEKAYNTINDSPELTTLSWELSTTPVDVPGFQPTSILTINSLTVDPIKLAALEALLYGSGATAAALPLPAAVAALVEDVEG